MEQYKRQRIFKVDYLQEKGKVELFKALNGMTSAEEIKQHFSKVFDSTHCAQSHEDCKIVERTIKLLMNTGVESKKFGLGSNVIRMYYYLNMPDEAYAAYQNVEFRDLFKDNTCHLLLMDLLYKHGQYSRAVEVFFNLERFNIFCVTLAFGSLYHINTPESLSKSQALLIHVATKYAVSRRAISFAAMHALNQDEPSRALETLKFCKPDSVASNIELMSLCKLHQVNDVLFHLSEILLKTNDISKLWGLRIYQDAWQEVLSVMENQGTDEDKEAFEDMKIQLKKRGVLSPQMTKSFLEWTIPGDFDYKKESAKRTLHHTTSRQPL